MPNFPMTLARDDGARFPFGIWFADASTVYVADEGDGKAADAATDTASGLQKWTRVDDTWQLAYSLQRGLNLGIPYRVPDGPQGEVYPPELSPATDGLRNITGTVNGDGTVTIYGVTSTVSASGDQGADPNNLVAITDTLSFTSLEEAADEEFTTLRSAGYGEVLRGVSLASPFTVARGGFDYDRHTHRFVQEVTMWSRLHRLAVPTSRCRRPMPGSTLAPPRPCCWNSPLIGAILESSIPLEL